MDCCCNVQDKLNKLFSKSMTSYSGQSENVILQKFTILKKCALMCHHTDNM